MEKQTSLLATKKSIKKPTSSKSSNIIKIFIDGASRNNPGPSGAGIFMVYDKKTICEEGYYLGKKTNNQAEYLALVLALLLSDQKAKKLNIKNYKLHITTDSELLTKQVKGIYKVRNQELAKLKKVIDKLLEDKKYTITHVLREKNKIADALANKGVDSKKKVPASFSKLLLKYEISI